MPNKINRRSFLSNAVCGMGAIAFSSDVLPFKLAKSITSNKTSRKKLLATTDYYDNILYSQSLFDRSQLDQLHKYLSSLGVTRHQWIVNTIWNLYDDPHPGFDILAEAADSAHSHGIEFYAEIKPFEGGGWGDIYPHSLPFPKGAIALKDIRGICPITRPFVAKNPHMCLKRRPDNIKASGPVSVIRLVKGDDSPTRIRAEHLTIWTSHQNNGFIQYKGAVSFRESVEWRPCYPKSKQCRILHLEGFQIPANHKYILVRCLLADKNGNFTNERGNIIELQNMNGDNIESILSSGPVDYKIHQEYYANPIHKEIIRYFRLPEVQEVFLEKNRMQKHYQDFYSFNESNKLTELYTLDKLGYVAAACGKPEYMLGNLHPIYPEVRKHWLDMVRYCLDRGVDGINFRTSNHTQSPEEWEYGFNEPVIKAAGNKTDYPSIRRINGDAYTQFLFEARDFIKSRGKSITIHLYSQMLMPDDRSERLSYIPPNFDWQWETWVREIADDLEFRGAWTLRPWSLQQVLETFSAVTKEANKPFYFQGNMKELGFNGPHQFSTREIEMIQNYPGIEGFVLYETANFTRMNEKDEIEGSPDVENMIKTQSLFF